MSTARLIEHDVYEGDYAWECEQCKELWVFSCGTPEENKYHYCPSCGRKISEYVYWED